MPLDKTSFVEFPTLLDFVGTFIKLPMALPRQYETFSPKKLNLNLMKLLEPAFIYRKWGEGVGSRETMEQWVKWQEKEVNRQIQNVGYCTGWLEQCLPSVNGIEERDLEEGRRSLLTDRNCRDVTASCTVYILCGFWFKETNCDIESLLISTSEYTYGKNRKRKQLLQNPLFT